MGDRRLYDRVAINVPCCFYINNMELSGEIKNISDNGVFVQMDTSSLDIKKGTDFSLDAYMEYRIFHKKKETRVKLDGKVVHVSSSGVGCKINPSSYEWSKIVDEIRVHRFCKYKLNGNVLTTHD